MQVSLLDESIQPKADRRSLKTGREMEKLGRRKPDKAKAHLCECVFEWQEEEHKTDIYADLLISRESSESPGKSQLQAVLGIQVS